MSYRPKGETTHYILHVASLRGPPIGGQENDRVSYLCSAPYTLSRFAGLPLKGKREIWREKQGVIYFRYHFGVFPLWWLAPPPCTVGSMSYDTESKSVTLALYSSPDRAIPQPSARRAVKLTNPPAVRPVHLKNLSLHNLSTQPAAVRRPQPSGRRPVNPHARRALSLFFY